MTASRTLFGIAPETHVEGFSTEIERCNETIFADERHAKLCLPFYYEIAIICDGTNPFYGKAGYYLILITQKITPKPLAVQAKDMVFLFDPDQRITAVRLVESDICNEFGVWLHIIVDDDYERSETNLLIRPLLRA